jgi:hypothetical protein
MLEGTMLACILISMETIRGSQHVVNSFLDAKVEQIRLPASPTRID